MFLFVGLSLLLLIPNIVRPFYKALWFGAWAAMIGFGSLMFLIEIITKKVL